MTPATLGSRLRDARKRKGLTQEALGKLAGVRGQTVSEIERSSGANTRTLEKLARALGVPPSVLIDPPVRGARKP